jgi:hypothetical protein
LAIPSRGASTDPFDSFKSRIRPFWPISVSESELQKGLAFLRASEAGAGDLTWQRYAQVLLSANAFNFLD